MGYITAKYLKENNNGLVPGNTYDLFLSVYKMKEFKIEFLGYLPGVIKSRFEYGNFYIFSEYWEILEYGEERYKDKDDNDFIYTNYKIKSFIREYKICNLLC